MPDPESMVEVKFKCRRHFKDQLEEAARYLHSDISKVCRMVLTRFLKEHQRDRGHAENS